MRQYRILDEAPDDDAEDELPRVVSIGTAQRGRYAGESLLARRAAWTPRDGVEPSRPHRPEPVIVHASGGISRTHQFMIASFVIICAGMVLGMLMVRVWDDASRTVAALPSNGRAAPIQQPASTPAPLPAAPSDQAPPPGSGAVTTEIRVLEPNYTVAPGESLGIIARKHGTSVDALASINNLENRNSLSVGQKLIIP